MKILLVNPPSADIFRQLNYALPPMGLMSLAAYLRAHGYDVAIEDFQFQPRGGREFDFSPYAVVGIGSDTTRFPSAQAIARRAKQAGAVVIMGGPHPGYVPDEALAGGDVDAVVTGEGEATMLELVRTIEAHRPIEGLAGVAVRRDGKTIVGPPRSFIEPLDELPFPARDLLPLERYRATRIGERPLAQIVTSRGCSHDCHFCSSSRFWGRQLRFRRIESVVAELAEVYDRWGFRAVAFVDDNFAARPDRVIAISEAIVQRKWDLWWWCFARADNLVRHPEMIAPMARSGCKTIYVGVESASEESLREYGKRSSLATVAEAFALLRRHGIQIFASYILGGLPEDHASTEATIEMARRLDSNIAQFSILTPYPGTRLFEQLKDQLRHRDWRRYDMLHLVFRHPRFSAFRLYGYLLKANVRFYTRSREARRGFWMVMRRQGVGLRKIGQFFRSHLFGRG
jgi:anaerobic magnesium-protoporphyrin IX monomethyl ester cyclase